MLWKAWRACPEKALSMRPLGFSWSETDKEGAKRPYPVMDEKKVVISRNRFELMIQAILAAGNREQEKFSQIMEELIDLKCKITDAETFRTNSP